jgi:hypothetical protein
MVSRADAARRDQTGVLFVSAPPKRLAFCHPQHFFPPDVKRFEPPSGMATLPEKPRARFVLRMTRLSR